MKEILHRQIMRMVSNCQNDNDKTRKEAAKQAVKLRKHIIDEKLIPKHNED